MKIAARTIFLIGGILAIVSATFLLLGSIPFFIYSSPAGTNAIIQGLENGTIRTTFVGTIEQQAAAIQNMLFGFAIAFTVTGVLVIPTAILAFMARNTDNQGLFIANIILSVFNGQIICLIGGILGLVAGETKEETLE